MKKILLIIGISVCLVQITYALPIGVLVLGYDFFILFFGWLLSG
ncbi:MAG: hypothetical protein Q9M94_05020 [Candidatus Gracilibacteria bacterium]|nr:hypothetical protein [Candidatus Gracilibacteria bacterium]